MGDRSDILDGNFVTLREYLSAQVDALGALTTERLRAIAQAIELAAARNDERLLRMNEWRETVKDILAGFADRKAVDAGLQQLNERISQEVRRIDGLLKPFDAAMNIAQGRASQGSVNAALAVAVLGILISLGGLILAVAR